LVAAELGVADGLVYALRNYVGGQVAADPFPVRGEYVGAVLAE
jgi:hypothetical protein